jgi:serine-type D-Ala-D-Ala endopeptidase (penicillin-binding protein 7)
MPLRFACCLVLAACASLAAAAPLALPAPHLASARALVMDATTGEVLLAKGADEVASIASLTKLMTAMVVLDAGLDPFEILTIDAADLDTIKGTRSGVPVGSRFTRRSLVRLALLSSDNRAAAALARTYPGGHEAFQRAVARKIAGLGLAHTSLVEPTGLSPFNRSSAADLARVLAASVDYALIGEITRERSARVAVNGVDTEFRNTNRLVGREGWNVLVSKTGFTREAGVCLTMAFDHAGRRLLMVLMGAGGSDARASDATNIRRWLGGERERAPTQTAAARKRTRPAAA